MPDIIHRVGIAAEPMRVFQALTSVDAIRAWWIDDAQGDASEGGTFQFGGHRLTVVQADPAQVAWRYDGPAADWIVTEITFQLEWKDGQTFVRFTQAGWREANDFMRHCSTKWAVFLVSLKNLVERGVGQPKPQDVQIEVGG
jgi:uncharacterized protein YndB with AHSA1/START domain